MSAAKLKTLAIACGGTGGHFYPGLTLAREYRQAGGEVVMFLGGHHVEEQLTTAQGEGFQAVRTPAVRLPRNPFAAIVFPFRFLRCVWHCWRELRRRRIAVALGMGSFTSVPLGLGAVLAGIPLALHEGNATLGQANRFLSRWARVLGLSFPLRRPRPTRARQEVVGMPVRDAIIAAANRGVAPAERDAICRELGLDPTRPVIMIFGGSQGSRTINWTVLEMLPLLDGDAQRLQFIHLTGTLDNATFERAYAMAGVKAVVKARDQHIERLYQIADHVICRAGASTILELALLGKAPIMIPFSAAKEAHQLANAEAVVAVNGGWMIAEDQLTPAELRRLLQEITRTPPDRGANIRQLARPHAAADMVRLLQQLA